MLPNSILFYSKPPHLDFICSRINILEDMISNKYVNELKDIFHNAISIGVVQHAFYIFLGNTSYFSLINL